MTAKAESNGSTRIVKLIIPAKPEYITLGRLALTGLSRLRPVGDETLADLKLALTEACSNSVRHAYAEQDGVVEIVYELHADRLVIEVADEGEGFAPDATEEETVDGLPSLSEGGLGIAIIRALADDLEIGPRHDGRGSRLRFAKVLSS